MSSSLGRAAASRHAWLLAEGHHVDDAGNLISCTYVDFRDPDERFPITTLRKASSKRHAIPGCETIRVSKPRCFLEQGEGIAGDDDTHHGTNGWVYCASIEPETAAEQAAWRTAMPTDYAAVSPLRRPRAFARALGSRAAEQAGPRGRIVLLRNTVNGRAFSTAHRSQTVYHGPVVYADDPYRCLENAASDLELLLMLVFLKDATRSGQREYRFAVWAEQDPEEDRLDLEVSRGLLDAMCREGREAEGSGFAVAGIENPLAVEALDAGGRFPGGVRVEALPTLLSAGNPTVAPRRYELEMQAEDRPESTTACAAVDALRRAVGMSEAGSRKDAAAAAWHAEPVARFFDATFGGAIAGVWPNEDGSPWGRTGPARAGSAPTIRALRRQRRTRGPSRRC